MMIKRLSAAVIAAAFLFSLVSCGGEAQKAETAPPVIDGAGEAKKVELYCAECFTLYEYENGDSYIVTDDGSKYLVTDLDPDGLDPDTAVLRRNADHIYMAASAAMSFYDSLGRISDIRFSAIKESGWDIESAAEAMRSGDMVYAGKYSEPDYELLLTEGCSYSIQSTMSDHVPKVRQKLTEIGIPVFVDRSSYESHPLGRCEWIKVYAHLTGDIELGDRLFEEQKEHFDRLEGIESSGKTVVFFYISASGKIVTRKAGDYVTTMIEMAGGENVFDFLGDDNASSTVTLEPEEFCIHAKDADIIIYNINLGGEIHSIDELVEKNELLAEFRAVKEGNVFCTSRSVYQEIMKMGEILTDFHTVFSGSGDELKYLYRIY